MNEISRRKEIAIKAAKEAGEVLTGNFKKSIKPKSKGNRQLVTEVDLKAEDAIVKLIKAEFPKDNILSEESPYPKFDTPLRWIIDPLDGTHNYIHKIDVFGTSIALESEGEVVCRYRGSSPRDPVGSGSSSRWPKSSMSSNEMELHISTLIKAVATKKQDVKRKVI